jgi:hypothetical protein
MDLGSIVLVADSNQLDEIMVRSSIIDMQNRKHRSQFPQLESKRDPRKIRYTGVS